MAASLLFVLMVPASVLGQTRPVPSISLDRGATEFAESFSQLSSLVELRDGRLIVLDSKEKDLRLVDLAHGTAARVSRLGGGPLEYRVPGALLTGAADTVVYFDITQRRFLLLSQAGIPLATLPYGPNSAVGTPQQMQAMISQMMPTSTDAGGRLYGVTTGMSIPVFDGKSPPMPKFADTVEIQSLNMHGGQAITLARIRSPMAQSSPKMELVGTAMKMTMTAPDFRPGTAWAALPDGRVAVLRDGIYRVHFITATGTETIGPAIPFTPIPVTAVERRNLVDSLRTLLDSALKAMRKSVGAVGDGTGHLPNIEMQVLEPSTWAATKPAYIVMTSAPDGRLWVMVSGPAGTTVVRFDLLDSAGALLAHVQLAPGERFAGVGRSTVYTIRTDQDDLQYLRRYTLPKLR